MIAPKPNRAAPAWPRVLAAVLAFLGLPAALVGWMAVFGGPAEAIEDLSVALRLHDPIRLREALYQIPWLLGFSAQIAWGYLVWGGWLRIVAGRKVSTQRFWLLASLQHLIWAGLGLMSRSPDPVDKFIGTYGVAASLACLGAGLASGLSLSRPKPSHEDWPALA